LVSPTVTEPPGSGGSVCELELWPLLELPSQQTYTSHSGACSIDFSAPHSNSSRSAGNTMRSPSRLGQRDNSSIVPVRPPGPPGHPELELESPLLDDEDDELLLLDSAEELLDDELLLELLELDEDDELLDDDDELELDELLLEELLLDELELELELQQPSPIASTSHLQLSA
jgi:hypothetical protein